ncbi:MAG TPA: oxygen-independent coproporphyrinogen III oxidase [Draconibacterium sp.]|nr:oxygen-independent coproporphyrinogen III oxidase [Draconibacterium sp.]
MIDNKLLQKYNNPVPRYTSYPPANFFTEEFSQADFRKALTESNEFDPQNISFYFHIPFCKQICYFCGCNHYGISNDHIIDDYMQALKVEIKTMLSHIDKNRKISQIHYGGGTPNAIPVEYLQEINEILLSEFSTIDQPEIAIECNPAYLTFDQMDGLKKAGFKRFSLGIQDFDTDVLKAVNREKPGMPVKEIMDYLKNGDPEVAVNLDFIYGLPLQSASSFANAIEKAIELRPDRLVTFSYAHVPWVSPIQKKLDKVGLPESDEKMKMFENGTRLLTENGYHAIGFDHFALENDELTQAYQNKKLHRNFQGYCTRRTTGQVYALGVTSISQLSNVYAQNTKKLSEYIEQAEKGEIPTLKGYRLTKDQMVIREVINELMCNEQIVWSEIGERFKMSGEEVKKSVVYDTAKLNEFEADGLIKLTDEKLEMTDEGLILIRNVAASLDPLLIETTKTFSKSV